MATPSIHALGNCHIFTNGLTLRTCHIKNILGLDFDLVQCDVSTYARTRIFRVLEKDMLKYTAQNLFITSELHIILVV